MNKATTGVPVTRDMVGSTTGAYTVSWTESEVMLYALGIGAGLGDPSRDLALTTENSDGCELQVIPSFLAVLCTRRNAPAVETLDIAQLLHGSQSIELLRALPSAGLGSVSAVIETVSDKGQHAVITQLSTLRLGDAEGPVIGRSRMEIFVRDGGGFCGPRSTEANWQLPAREPDTSTVQATRPEQALLYRLSGDRNRLHSDPTFARAHGFKAPILHGLCTYGFACRALIQAIAVNGEQLSTMSGRFDRPVFPGDILRTQTWLDHDKGIMFQTFNGAGEVVIDRGRATFAT